MRAAPTAAAHAEVAFQTGKKLIELLPLQLIELRYWVTSKSPFGLF